MANHEPKERTWHRTTITVVVLSEEPYRVSGKSLSDIAFDIYEGHCVGQRTVASEEVLDANEAAAALLAVGSEPEFFLLSQQEDGTYAYDEDM